MLKQAATWPDVTSFANGNSILQKEYCHGNARLSGTWLKLRACFGSRYAGGGLEAGDYGVCKTFSCIPARLREAVHAYVKSSGAFFPSPNRWHGEWPGPGA